MRSPTLLLIRMNAAETSASSATADWTLLTVVSRSCTTAEIDTFITDVSTTSTNIAIDSRTASRVLLVVAAVPPGCDCADTCDRPARVSTSRLPHRWQRSGGGGIRTHGPGRPGTPVFKSGVFDAQS